MFDTIAVLFKNPDILGNAVMIYGSMALMIGCAIVAAVTIFRAITSALFGPREPEDGTNRAR